MFAVVFVTADGDVVGAGAVVVVLEDAGALGSFLDGIFAIQPGHGDERDEQSVVLLDEEVEVDRDVVRKILLAERHDAVLAHSGLAVEPQLPGARDGRAVGQTFEVPAVEVGEVLFEEHA